MEKKFDDKLIVFRDSILEELRKEIGAVKSDSVSRFTAVNSAVADFTINTHKTINDNQVKRETFEKNIQLKMENFLNEQKSIDISELTNSLQFETNERIDENKKQREGIQKNQESITSLDNKINYLLSTTMQKMPPIYESESGDLKSRIKELQENEITSLRTMMKRQEDKIRDRGNTKNIDKDNLLQQPANETSEKKKAEIMMIFDSNRKHLDRKKLWKLDSSIFKRYDNLHEVNKAIDESEVEELNYILISIGVNDLDLKDHMQVFGELEAIINKIREK